MKPFIQHPDEYPRENRQHQHRYIIDRPPRQIEQQGEHAIFDKMECLNDVGIGVAGAEDPREERASHQGCAKGEIAKHPAPSERVARAEASLGAANPTLLVGTPQDTTARLLNQWNPLYSAPKVEPPKTPLPAPNFDVPRRKF